MTATATTDRTHTPYSRPVFGALYKRLKMEARLQAEAEANTATTDATRIPFSPIMSDLYTRKMEAARLQAEADQQEALLHREQEEAIRQQEQAHQQVEARRQQSAAKWKAAAERQQQRR